MASDEPLFENDWLPLVPAYLFAGVLFGLFVRNYSMSRRVRSWPTAVGTVVRVGTTVDDGATDIDIGYEFAVDGMIRRGNRLRFGGGPYYRQATVEAILGRYPRGARVAVHYDPTNPNRCALESHFEWLGWAPVLLFGFVTLIPATYHLIVDYLLLR